jgi:sugar phosphate isomerase/epimerase
MISATVDPGERECGWNQLPETANDIFGELKTADAMGGFIVALMKLTISTLACPNWDLQTIIKTAAANGIAGIDFRGIGPEIDITRLPAFNAELPETLATLKEHALQMPCLNTSVTLVTLDPAKWETMLGEMQRYAQLASRTGTQFLRFFGGSVPETLTRAEAGHLAQRHLRQAIKICKPHGCRPLLETHDAWVTTAQVLELMHEFDPADAGVLWDLEHPWRKGESAADTAAGLKKWIKHIHIKDTVREASGNQRPTLLGEGELPLRDCMNALADIGYDGWIALETEKRWHPEGPDPETSLPQFARYMNSMGCVR